MLGSWLPFSYLDMLLLGIFVISATWFCVYPASILAFLILDGNVSLYMMSPPFVRF